MLSVLCASESCTIPDKQLLRRKWFKESDEDKIQGEKQKCPWRNGTATSGGYNRNTRLQWFGRIEDELRRPRRRHRIEWRIISGRQQEREDGVQEMAQNPDRGDVSKYTYVDIRHSAQAYTRRFFQQLTNILYIYNVRNVTTPFRSETRSAP